MDVFSHGLWGYALCYPKSKSKLSAVKPWQGMLFGILPDAIAFLPAQIYFLFHRVAFDPSLFLPVPKHWVFNFAIESYNYTHSLVIFGLVLLSVWAWKKSLPWPLLAWGLHICMDIFTHPDFFQTPLLYPISNFKFIGLGLSWTNPWVFLIDWLLLLAVFLYIYKDQKKLRKQVLT